RVDVLHLHHGVWLNVSQTPITQPFGGFRVQPFAAAGEEKTTLWLPQPYGYFNHASDRWLMNYMIHNLTPRPDKVYLTYDVDLVRPGARVAKPARAGPVAGGVGHSVRIFRSAAKYWDPRGPISWDMAMDHTPANWRVRVRRGDTLRVSATYDTRQAAWYEAMG